jgi:hypothetical protein
MKDAFDLWWEWARKPLDSGIRRRTLATVSLPSFGSREAWYFSVARGKPMANDPYAEFETALTDLLTERDRFLERRLRLPTGGELTVAALLVAQAVSFGVRQMRDLSGRR